MAKLSGITVVFFLSLLTGCGGTHDHGPNDPDADGHHGHAHHAHGDLGPNGGHVVEFDREGYHAEWLHDDKAGKLTVIILDESAGKEAAIPASSVAITISVKDAAGTANDTTYELVAVNASQSEPRTASRFENSKPDKNLLTHAKMGDAVNARLVVKIGDETYVGPIKHEGH